jgi:plasmid stabilization system protein ParE
MMKLLSNGSKDMQIRWSKQANQNLSELELYIARDNPQAAIQISLKSLETIYRRYIHP